MSNPIHAYVFTFRDGLSVPIYERTFPADRYGLVAAACWLNRSKYRGFISVDCLPFRSFY